MSINQRKDNKHAIVLVSGGMDSLVTAAMAASKHKKISFIHLNYGQRTEKKELESFFKIAKHYGVPKERQKIIDVSFLKQIGGSSLTDKKISVKKFRNRNKEIPDSYVPFRNTHLISMAVSWAEVISADYIYIGAVSEDSSGYPDCRPKYYDAFNKLIKVGTKDGKIKIKTPIINFSKSEIIKKACLLNAPLQYTWSCYARNDRACGVCDSCALRLRAFQNVDIIDPIDYVKRPDYVYVART